MTLSPNPLALLPSPTRFIPRVYFPGDLGVRGRKGAEKGTFDGIIVNCLGLGGG